MSPSKNLNNIVLKERCSLEVSHGSEQAGQVAWEVVNEWGLSSCRSEDHSHFTGGVPSQMVFLPVSPLGGVEWRVQGR